VFTFVVCVSAVLCVCKFSCQLHAAFEHLHISVATTYLESENKRVFKPNDESSTSSRSRVFQRNGLSVNNAVDRLARVS